MSTTVPRMMAIGDAVATTGFSRVMRGVLDPLVEQYDIHQLALSYYGDPHDWPWKLYPASVGGNAFGTLRVAWMFDHLKPDVIFMVSNLPRVKAYLEALGERARTVPIVAYVAVEAGPISPALVPFLKEVDRLVFYTEQSKREFEKAIAGHENGALRPCFRLDVRPHGIDTSTFYPVDPEEQDRAVVRDRIRTQLFKGDEEHVNSFIVLNANRNQARKRIDLTVRGFAEFARDKDKYVKLHLHMGTPDVGWDLVSLARRHGVYDRLILTNLRRDLPSVSLKEMNLYFNSADVGINTSSSEGWGLVSFEHAATCTAQIVPRHASLAELWEGIAEMMEPVLTLHDPEMHADQSYVSPEQVAASLERLYDDSQYRTDVADRCYEHATQPSYQWSDISRRWGEMLAELL